MRSLAIDKLSTLTSPIDKVVLAREYGVSHWLPLAYRDICAREEWLSDEEGYRLGLGDVLKIGRARQAMRSTCPATPLFAIIKQVFDCNDEASESEQTTSTSPRKDSPVTAISSGDANKNPSRDTETSSQNVQDQPSATVTSTPTGANLALALSHTPDVIHTPLSAGTRKELKAAIPAVEIAQGGANEAKSSIPTHDMAQIDTENIRKQCSAEAKEYAALQKDLRTSRRQLKAIENSLITTKTSLVEKREELLQAERATATERARQEDARTTLTRLEDSIASAKAYLQAVMNGQTREEDSARRQLSALHDDITKANANLLSLREQANDLRQSADVVRADSEKSLVVLHRRQEEYGAAMERARDELQKLNFEIAEVRTACRTENKRLVEAKKATDIAEGRKQDTEARAAEAERHFAHLAECVTKTKTELRRTACEHGEVNVSLQALEAKIKLLKEARLAEAARAESAK
jgi:hypothetical protein